MTKKDESEFKLWHTPFYIVGAALAGVFYTGVFAYKLAKGTLLFSAGAIFLSIEGIQNLTKKQQKKLQEHITNTARKRVENHYKKVNKKWTDEITEEDYRQRVAIEETRITAGYKRKAGSMALGATGLGFLNPKRFIKDLIADDEDFDDTEV
ncbi:hypothetical protein N9I86_02225 [Hyphomicrobiales bacterium]|nr:hypothetical protein [Hyphomicrobiales bacterium]